MSYDDLDRIAVNSTMIQTNKDDQDDLRQIMSFDDGGDDQDQDDKKGGFELDSPKGSVSSKNSFIMFDEKNLIDEDDDEFEDAVSETATSNQE